MDHPAEDPRRRPRAAARGNLSSISESRKIDCGCGMHWEEDHT